MAGGGWWTGGRAMTGTHGKKLYQDAIDIFLTAPAKKFSNTIVIVIEMVIRINQTLHENFRADFDGKIFTRPCSRKVKRICMSVKIRMMAYIDGGSGFSTRPC